ncbi:19266_t:CDS:2 [Rhizophagus irregularis]|nr:19266_t:CDS:2 [Rhizophagus irregularis]
MQIVPMKIAIELRLTEIFHFSEVQKSMKSTNSSFIDSGAVC